MTKSEARHRGLRLAAKITGIGGIAIAAVALAEARTASAATHEATGESALKAQSGILGHCGCAPCWGPPAPPPRGAAS